MTERDERGRFVKASADDDALHDAMQGLLPDLQKAADEALQAVVQMAKARPLMALLVAALIGFIIAAVTSK